MRVQERRLKAEQNRKAKEEAKERREAAKQLKLELLAAQKNATKEPLKAMHKKTTKKVVIEVGEVEEEPVQVLKSGRVIKKKTRM